MKYQSRGSVEALKIVSKSRHVVDNFYCVMVEPKPGYPALVGCVSNEKPLMGDYVIFQSVTDVYCCPAEVFEQKYEVAPF